MFKLGAKHSETTREKMRLSHLGYKHPEWVKEKMSFSQKGKVFSDETKAKLSQWQIGRKLSKSTLEKISLALKGRKISEETKKKISLAKLGKSNPLTDEGRRRIGEASRKRMLGTKDSLETRFRKSRGLSGANSSGWKGGIQSENKRLRSGLEYRLWREAVFQRDNWSCVLCGSRNCKGLGKTIILEADHIKPFAYFPELRFDTNNGRTLCRDCHKKTETYGGKIRRDFEYSK